MDVEKATELIWDLVHQAKHTGSGSREACEVVARQILGPIPLMRAQKTVVRPPVLAKNQCPQCQEKATHIREGMENTIYSCFWKHTWMHKKEQ